VLYHVEELRFAYHKPFVLKGITLNVKRGEFIALVGPNGAGKSTLLKILAALLRKYSGIAEFDGSALYGFTPKAIAQRVAFVPQETHVMFPFTVGEMIMMGRLPHRTYGLFETSIDRDHARNAMQLTDTARLAEETFNQLSGGERQRVVLASALAQDPEVLLLDEPTVYLDLKHQIQFYDIVERLNSDRAITVISVTHDINLAARYARRMIVMRDGRIAADGHPLHVLTPKTLYEIFEITAAVVERPDGRGSYVIPGV